jgi:hypothetical protein
MHLKQWAAASALLGASALPLACSDGPASSDDSETDDTGSSESSESDDETESDEGTQNEILDVELVKHPHQPMVVDMIVRLLEPGELLVQHVDDAGVRVERTDGDGPSDEQTFRLRGLAPETAHSVAIELEESDAAVFDFTTDEALPGFLPAFAIENGNGTPEDVYRLFDVGQFPIGEYGGLFMADNVGTTRWYLGAPNANFGPGAVWSGIKLLDDGNLMFLRNDTLFVLGEIDSLDAPQLRISANELGVGLIHHDVIQLASGNFMTLSATIRDIDYPGEGTLPTVGDLLVEFDADGDVVWTWDAFDHLDPQRIRGGFMGANANTPGHDWTHANGIEYWADQELVIVCMRHQNWVVAIDHVTGDVEWYLGDEGDFTLGAGTWFFHPHSPQRQSDGSLLIYDNGINNPYVDDPDERSRAAQYALDLDAMTADLLWEDDEQDLMSPVMGDADRMPGGHVQILDSAIDVQVGTEQVFARIREMDPDADPQRVWSMTTPKGYFAYRALPTDRLVGMAAE